MLGRERGAHAGGWHDHCCCFDPELFSRPADKLAHVILDTCSWRSKCLPTSVLVTFQHMSAAGAGARCLCRRLV